MGCGIAREGAFLQSWESNRSVRMENVGETDIVNPWLSNGRNHFRSVEEIVASAVSPGMSDADKAFALWFQEIQYRHHSPGDNRELGDPVKVFNVYGYNTCGNDSISLATLWRHAGLKAAPARALGHCISQAFYDGGWHFYDGDMHCVYLLRDNQTVAGEQEIVRDHDLIKRTHSKGILFLDAWWSEPEMCAMYFFEGPVGGERGGQINTTMNMTLRPGEALVWRWGRLDPVKYHGTSGVTPTYKDVICNGLWEYRPDFSNAVWRQGAAAVEDVTLGPEGLATGEGKVGTIVWTMRNPYVFVGGRLEVEGAGARFFICQDGKSWRAVEDNLDANVSRASRPRVPRASGPRFEGGTPSTHAGKMPATQGTPSTQRRQDNLDKLLPIVGPACYEYQLKCELQGPARLQRLAIINDVQMAPLALPEMAVGENVFMYSDQSPGERQVRITHSWVERSTSRPPSAPTGAVFPPDGGEANGTDVVFRWAVPSDADGDAIADYQFELSPRADMRWPLSMSFYKLISRTADATKEKDKATGKERITVKSQYTAPQPGLLTPDCRYYWRVRAQDDKGMWGPWSKTWSFTPRGPAYPLDVTVDYDHTRGVGTLRWKANPVGRVPVKYRVYGSDEKGFTIADQRHQGVVGVTKAEMSDWVPWFPANFIAETTATELAVLGPDANVSRASRPRFEGGTPLTQRDQDGHDMDLPVASKTYYRVVAVDEQGKRSGPSDYATARRPVIYSKPVTTAQAGADYRYQVLANRSLGDLSARMIDGRQVSGYFDVEKPRFTLARGPAWLRIDEATGLLSGTPKASGQADVAVTVTIDRPVRTLDEAVLRWGNEKILAVDTERIGTTTQEFIIDVRR
jgi:hypothetical protein